MANPKRILVYGAGVLGCVLAHALHDAHHDVTLLARGDWKRTIDAEGVVIRHYIQRRTTRDRIPTVDALAPGDVYDVIFVVMQCTQLPGVLERIAGNRSARVVFVGNNMDAPSTEIAARGANDAPKEIAFAFQGTGGRREAGRVIGVYKGLSLTVGGLRETLCDDMRACLDEVFAGTGYRIVHRDHMDAWLKCHAVFILPICGVIYRHDGALTRATRADIHLALDATMEAYALFKRHGIPIVPARGEDDIANHRGIVVAALWLMGKTPIGRLAASDHAMAAVGEMQALLRAFEALRTAEDGTMAAWDALTGAIARRGNERAAQAHAAR